jgi:hypothetical protein
MLIQIVVFGQANNKGFPPQIIEFLGNQPITRVGRPFDVLATLSNPVTKKNIKSFNNEE